MMIRAVPACATTTGHGGYLPYCNAVHAPLSGNVPYSPTLTARFELLLAKTRACSPAVHGGLVQNLSGADANFPALVQSIALAGAATVAKALQIVKPAGQKPAEKAAP